MPEETRIEETIQEVDSDETTVAVADLPAGVSGDSDSAEETALESETDSDSSDSVTLPSDYLDVETFNEGVETILNAIEDTEDEVYTGSGVAAVSDDFFELPWNAVVFLCEDQEIVFPFDYADSVYVQDGELVNIGSSYTFGVVLSDSGLSNYVSSEVTVPTYHSSTWYQYLYNYGQPYRIVDRYVSSSGYYSSSTRESVDLEFSGGNDWSGWGYGTLFVFVIVILLILREVRTWLTS